MTDDIGEGSVKRRTCEGWYNVARQSTIINQPYMILWCNMLTKRQIGTVACTFIGPLWFCHCITCKLASAINSLCHTCYFCSSMYKIRVKLTSCLDSLLYNLWLFDHFSMIWIWVINIAWIMGPLFNWNNIAVEGSIISKFYNQCPNQRKIIGSILKQLETQNMM